MEDGEKKSYSPNKSGRDVGGFNRFLWNPDTREILGRTGESWLKITIFYIFFFAGLLGFLYFMIWILLQTLDDTKPKWVGDDGLIGSNPGVGFRPMPDPDANEDLNADSLLIKYQRESEDASGFWSKQLEAFIETSVDNSQPNGPNNNNHPVRDEKSPCPQMGLGGENNACTKENKFGYPEGKPCILLKLNKIYGWNPEPYNSSHQDKLPSDMPETVKNLTKRDPDPKVWFSCKGKTAEDETNLGAVDYFPGQGISTCHFPYEGQQGYKAPFIFVRLSNLKDKHQITVECKAWARNIRPSGIDRVGLVRFRVQIN